MDTTVLPWKECEAADMVVTKRDLVLGVTAVKEDADLARREEAHHKRGTVDFFGNSIMLSSTPMDWMDGAFDG
jgi:hypothetical protein